MGQPQVPIEVDDATGIWSVDAIPMILVPRHFFVNNHRAIEQAVGRERYSTMLFGAGHLSAWVWCEKEAVTHGLSGADVFLHYMKRLSQRGWAQFHVETLDPRSGRASIRVEHSVFVKEHSGPPERTCYMFRGWFCGALEFVAKTLGAPVKVDAAETCCAAEGSAACRFEVAPAP